MRGAPAARPGAAARPAGQGKASRTTTRITAATASACGAAPKVAISQLPVVPPTKPPRLQNPCDEDMIARPSRRSTSTALAFIATSMQPINPPKAAIAGVSNHSDGASTTSGRTAAPRPAQRPAAPAPSRRPISRPVNSIAPTAPRPRTRINRPSTASPMPWRGNSSGICGAQAPIRVPLAKNMAAAARRALRASISVTKRLPAARPAIAAKTAERKAPAAHGMLRPAKQLPPDGEAFPLVVGNCLLLG
jgi:hypothetical protein